MRDREGKGLGGFGWLPNFLGGNEEMVRNPGSPNGESIDEIHPKMCSLRLCKCSGTSSPELNDIQGTNKLATSDHLVHV